MRRFTRWSLCVSLTAVLAAGCDEVTESPSAIQDVPSRSATVVCEAPVVGEALTGLILGLEQEVVRLEGEGLLNEGQARALMRHLTNAERQAERGEYCAANNQIVAFREQLEDIVGEAAIPDRDAFELRLQSRLALGGPDPSPGYEEYAPGYQGRVRDFTIGGSRITAEVVDGLAIFGGDIILGFEDELDAGAAPTSVDGPQRTGPCSGDGFICGRWSDGIIGYDYQTRWGTDSDRMAGLIEQAIDKWEALSGMRFERRSSGERIVFREGSGCSSWIGRNNFAIFDPQYVFLDNDGCDDVGIITHEIGHAIGLYHEQARNDRDDFVAVHFDAIQGGKEHNFYKYVDLGRDHGLYDFNSIMHYPCDAFLSDGATRNSIEPIRSGITCDQLGQRDSLTVRDRLGSYVLYTPEFDIGGATDGQTADRFLLTADFVGETPLDDMYYWIVDRFTVHRGPTLSTLDLGLGEGPHRVSLWLGLRDNGAFQDLGWVGIDINIHNDAPVVGLGADFEAEENRSFTVFANVTDTEDGTCAPTVCTYTWDPEPDADLGGAARYEFNETGPVTISVTVEDGAGATGSDEVEVTIVNSPPTVTISSPAPGASFSTGSVVAIAGSATDPNEGPGPDDGDILCYSGHYTWSSSDPTDVTDAPTGCHGTITFGDPGPRTLTLEATDRDGNTGSSSIGITVEGCGATGCAPDVTFDFDTPPELDGSAYDPPFTGTGYLIDTEIHATASISDPDVPATTISYEWKVRPPCIGGCDAFVVGSGSLLPPNNAFLTWTPSADPRVTDYWPSCTSTALPFVISLHATDSSGNTRVYSRTVHLACDLI